MFINYPSIPNNQLNTGAEEDNVHATSVPSCLYDDTNDNETQCCQEQNLFFQRPRSSEKFQ